MPKSIIDEQEELVSPSLYVRGGGSTIDMSTVLPSSFAALGFVALLAKSIRRLAPLALAPLTGDVALTKFQQVLYFATCAFFAHAEGYKGFQLKFGPMVVQRSLSLSMSSPIHHILLGPFYAMGLFHATKKRKIVSWSVTSGVVILVALVKKLSYPWKNIVDAGVVVGLSWGAISIMLIYLRAILTGKKPDADACLP